MDIEKYKLLIYKRAHMAHIHSGLPFDECYNESYKIALEAAARFDPIKGKSLCAWLWDSIDGYMWNYGLVENRERREEFDSQCFVDHLNSNDKQFETIEFLDFIYKSLSLNSIKIIKLIFNPKIKIKTASYKRKKRSEFTITKDAIYKYLLSQGWRRIDITKSFTEIKTVLATWQGGTI